MRRSLKGFGDLCAAALVLAVCGWSPDAQAASGPASKAISVCHGYGCSFRSKLVLGPGDYSRIQAIMRAGARSPAAERAALKRAVQYFEERSAQVIGVRDNPKAAFGAARIKGQMDCIDESSNTTAFLHYLAGRGFLKFHKVGSKVSRGFFLDGRYPHWTAIVIDPRGVRWVVDSWYAPTGGAPDIFPYEEWKVRGVLQSGALD
ncbi:hypothetical protein [Mesorhizobium marinum]|uniref:Uncharacterized protein n=1 Tax=Mesorhizobium marinum TaxID=3228790 RepID=A0ABV3QXL4_9HYPH